MAHLPCEIQREIFKRLHVTDLIRCKSVCMSWLSLISDPLFIKHHLNHQHHNDCNNKRFEHRRITMSRLANYVSGLETENNFISLNYHHLIGSSNGLVCVSPSLNEIIVMNPSTREVKNVPKSLVPETDISCWGFGYDSINDDYKIVLGYMKGENNTCFHVFSLRYNTWKVIAEINYVFPSRQVGVLCDGVLHWLANDTSPEKKIVILSLHFSNEKFSEVPMPDDARSKKLYSSWKSSLMQLGTMNGRLCLFRCKYIHSKICVMNKEHSWEYFGSERDIKYDAVHMIKQLKNYIPNKRPLCHQVWPHGYCFIKNLMFFGTPIYVESLVSPHFHEKPQRKRRDQKF